MPDSDSTVDPDPPEGRLMTCGELVDLAAEEGMSGTAVADQFDRTLEKLIDARVREILSNTTAGNMI